VADSMAMIVPVVTVLMNLWLTPAGRTGRLWADLPGRFVFVGSLWYLVTCIQGPIQSLPSVQEYTHFNNWVIGHAHIAVLGFAGFSALGGLWHVLPLASGRKIYSQRLLGIQFVLVLAGIIGFFIVLTVAGLIQGGLWHSGEALYRVLPQLPIYMTARALLGILIISAAAIGLYNVIMTLRRGQAADATLDAEKSS